ESRHRTDMPAQTQYAFLHCDGRVLDDGAWQRQVSSCEENAQPVAVGIRRRRYRPRLLPRLMRRDAVARRKPVSRSGNDHAALSRKQDLARKLRRGKMRPEDAKGAIEFACHRRRNDLLDIALD